MSRRRALSTLAFAAGLVTVSPAGAVVCAVNPFVCCPQPCPVIDAARFSLNQSASGHTSSSISQLDNIITGLDGVNAAIGTATSPIAIARNTGASMIAAGTQALQNSTPALANAILQSSPQITGGALSQDAIAQLTQAATSIARDQLLPTITQTMIAAIPQPLTIGSSAGFSSSIATAAQTVVQSTVSPGLAQAMTQAAALAVAARGSGGLSNLTGDLAAARQQIALDLATSIISRAIVSLQATIGPQILNSLASSAAALPSGLNLLPVATATPIGTLRPSVVTTAIESTGMTSLQASTHALAFDNQARGRSLDSVSTAWRGEQTTPAGEAVLPGLARRIDAATNVRNALRVRSQLVQELVRRLVHLQSQMAAYTSLRAAHLLQETRMSPPFRDNPTASIPPAAAPRPFLRNGAPLPSAGALAASLSALQLQNSLSSVYAMNQPLAFAQQTIDSHTNAVASTQAAGAQLITTLGSLFQNPGNVFASVSTALLQQDRTTWADTGTKTAAAATATSAVLSSIVANPAQWGVVRPDAFSSTSDASSVLQSFMASASPQMQTWLDQSKHERFLRGLADGASLDQLRLVGETQQLAAANNITGFGPQATTQEIQSRATTALQLLNSNSAETSASLFNTMTFLRANAGIGSFVALNAP